MDSQLTDLLRCPDDHSCLQWSEPELLAQLNAAREAGALLDRTGQPVIRLLEGGLVREAGDLLYPVVDGVPLMLAGEAIPLEQLLGREGDADQPRDGAR